MKKLHIFLIFLATLILLYIPFISDFLHVFNTLYHELGHALATLVFGGEVKSISLNMDGSGLTESLIKKSFIVAFAVSIAGYTSVPIITLLYSYIWKKDFQLFLSIVIFGSTLLTFIFFVRNVYGAIWCVVAVILLSFFFKFRNKNLLRVVNLGIINLLLVSSFSSSLTILLISIYEPTKAGDASSLHAVTHIPSIVWGVFFVLFNLIISFFVVKVLFKSKKVKKEENNDVFNPEQYNFK